MWRCVSPFGVGDVAADLRLIEPIRHMGERHRVGVAFLRFKLVVIERIAMHARGCAGLESPELQPQPFQMPTQSLGCGFTHATTRRFAIGHSASAPA